MGGGSQEKVAISRREGQTGKDGTESGPDTGRKGGKRGVERAAKTN